MENSETHTAMGMQELGASWKDESTSASRTAHTRLNSSGEQSESRRSRLFFAKRPPAMARFRQLRLHSADVTLSVTESHPPGDNFDRRHALRRPRPGWSG